MIPVKDLTIAHVTNGKQIDVKTPINGYVLRIKRVKDRPVTYAAIWPNGGRNFYPSIADLRVNLGRM